MEKEGKEKMPTLLKKKNDKLVEINGTMTKSHCHCPNDHDKHSLLPQFSPERTEAFQH